MAGEEVESEYRWDCAQQLVYWMVLCHYLKEVFEALAVHYFK